MFKKKYFKTFLLTFIILLIILLIIGIYPFGDKTLIVSDLRDQYLPFINYLKSILNGNNNIFYTFSGSLGENFFTMSAYYLMSIFNIFTLFFKTDLMPLVLTFIILIKISLSSMTMHYYLESRYLDKKENIFFALCYGLMSYTMAFYFHIMWLDSLILLPLMIKGIEEIVDERKSFLYIVSLTLIILSNYYMGVIVCLFSVLYFVYYLLLHYSNIYLKKVIGKYLCASLLSGLLCSFLLIPVLFSILNGKAVVDDVNVVTPYYFNSIDILSKLFISSFDISTIWHGGPNLFVGSLIIFLNILYFINSKISKRERMIHLIFLIIIFLSFRIHMIDLLFHGLTEPNCFDFRHAFIMSFMLIKIGRISYQNLSFDRKKLIVILFSLLILHIIIYFGKISYYQNSRIAFLVISYIGFLLLAYFLYKKKKVFVFGFLILDLMINSINIFSTITSYEQNASDLSEFKEYVSVNKEIIETIKNEDPSWYRMEKTYHLSNSINDSMLFDYAGISHFDSTSNVHTEKFLESIGYRRMMSRAFYNEGSTKFIEMLLGIKYVVSDAKVYNDYLKLFQKGDLTVYRNPYYQGMGYLLSNNYNSIMFNENIFDNLNIIYQNILETSDVLYKKQIYNLKYYGLRRENNRYYGNGYLEYSFDVKTNDNYYLYFQDNLVRENFKTATIIINDKRIENFFNKYHYGMIDLGKFPIGSSVHIKIEANALDSYMEFMDGLIYSEKEDGITKIATYLKKNALNIKLVNSSHLEFEVSNSVKRSVLLTIPYEDGWNILDNGKKITYQEAFNGLISFDLGEGEHLITMSFIPKGLKEGVIISLITLVLVIVWLRKEKYEKKN